MTSIPASRRARAITFAPRSCPSRPGFATSTRIFCSVGIFFARAVVHVPTRIANVLGYNRKANPVAPGRALHSLDVQTSPQIPAGDAAIWLPRPGNFLHLQWFGQLAFVVVLLDRHLDAVIARRQHVWPLQREHEKYVRGPNADALYLRQVFDNLFVGHLSQASEVEFATAGAFCHVEEIGRFLFRESHGTHFLRREFEDSFWSDRLSGKVRKSLENRYGGFPI